MKKLIIILSSLFIGLASASFAGQHHTMNMKGKKITVRVVVDKDVTSKMRILGTGFSVAGKSKGGPGSDTTKTGPVGGKYSFGFRSGGRDIGCGESVLKKDSTVVLYYKKGKCTHKIFSK